MTIPRFTAEASLRTGRAYRVTHAEQSVMGVAPARMKPQWCYWKDSNCTQFCGRVQDPDWRYECFSLCDKYLDNCLSRGTWTDQASRF